MGQRTSKSSNNAEATKDVYKVRDISVDSSFNHKN
jgi:hypothetical protein